MISILSEGFLGKKLYAAVAAMKIRGKPSDAPVVGVFNLNDVLQFVVYYLSSVRSVNWQVQI